MKKTLLTFILALVLGLGATAQTSEWYDNPYSYQEDYESVNKLAELLQMIADASAFDWRSNRDAIGDFSFPGSHTLDYDNPAPLGSGIVLLAGLGVAYAAIKRRKEE